MKRRIEAPKRERRARVADTPGAALGTHDASQDGPQAAPDHPTARSLRQAAMWRMQRSQGNRAAQRFVEEGTRVQRETPAAPAADADSDADIDALDLGAT